VSELGQMGEGQGRTAEKVNRGPSNLDVRKRIHEQVEKIVVSAEVEREE
jgi:hypothetical protein